MAHVQAGIVTDRLPRTVFMGTPEFAVPSLRALVEGGFPIVGVYTQPDRPSGRGRKLVPSPVKLAAAEYDIPTYQPERLRDAQAMETLQALSPELIIVAAYGQILRPAIIDLPDHGCLNVHASLLPRHRGASCIASAILAGDAETGVSIMKIDPGMDTGPVLSRRATPILDGDTTGALTGRLATLGASLLVDTLPGYLNGSLTPEPQGASLATLAPLLRKERGEIDWSKPAHELWREVRAFNPWPLSSTTLNGERIQILEAAVSRVAASKAEPPGMVIGIDPLAAGLSPDARQNAGFGVSTGDGVLVPLTLRRAGRGAVTGAEFMRGLHGPSGLRFGS